MNQINTIASRGRFSRLCGLFTVAILAATGLLTAQPTVTADQVACVPVRDNAVVWATINGVQPGANVRLYFRRLNDVVEDLYFMNMLPSDEAGRYWGVLPKPEKRTPDRHEISKQREPIVEAAEWASWWREKEASTHRNPTGDLDDDKIREHASLGTLESRHWMNQLSDEEFQKSGWSSSSTSLPSTSSPWSARRLRSWHRHQCWSARSEVNRAAGSSSHPSSVARRPTSWSAKLPRGRSASRFSTGCAKGS